MDGITSEFGAVTELLKDNEMKSWKWAVRSSGLQNKHFLHEITENFQVLVKTLKNYLLQGKIPQF